MIKEFVTSTPSQTLDTAISSQNLQIKNDAMLSSEMIS